MCGRYQGSVEEMQSLGESMEETINQLRQNLELVCNRTELMTLTQRMVKLCNGVDSCRNDIDEIKITLTSDDKVQDRKEECEIKVTKAQNAINRLKNSVSHREREIRECEQQIIKLEITWEAGVESNLNCAEIRVAALCASSLCNYAAATFTCIGIIRFKSLLIPSLLSGGGTSMLFARLALNKALTEPVDTADIRNQIQSQIDKKDSYQNQMNYDKLSIESNQKDIVKLKNEIQECQIKMLKCREMVSVTTSFEKILLHWLRFLKDLTLKMNYLEYVFEGCLAVKDTVAYREYVGLINGSAASKSLKFAKNMRQIASMDPMDIILSFQCDD